MTAKQNMTSPIDTPLSWETRAKNVVPIVEAYRDEAESIRHLPEPVARAYAENGLYRVAAPKLCGGADVDAATQMRIIEIVSEADGSSGWNLMIGIETFGLVSPSMQSCLAVIEDPLKIMASSTAAVGTAERASNGWVVNGQWQFVSGVHNADVFGATVQKYEKGEKVSHERFYAVVEKGDFEIVDTWHVAGMRGSGSHDVRIESVLVPAEHIVATLGAGAMPSNQLKMPLGVRLTFNKIGVGLGIARAAITEFADFAQQKKPRFSGLTLKDRPFAQRAIAQAEIRIRGARAALYEQAEYVWEKSNNDLPLSDKERGIVHLLASDAAQAIVDCLDVLLAAAGTSANVIGNRLDRLARDARVIRQHATVAPHHIDDAAAVLLGGEPKGILQM